VEVIVRTCTPEPAGVQDAEAARRGRVRGAVERLHLVEVGVVARLAGDDRDRVRQPVDCDVLDDRFDVVEDSGRGDPQSRCERAAFIQ
jgi:hypothetical protein